ncbi:hypothetical protein ES703_27110 [subsurface metagenome]
MAYQLVQTYKYAEYTTYSGIAERQVWDFSLGPEQFPGVMTIADKLINEFKQAVEDDAGTPLYLQVYCDTSPIFETKFRIIAYAYTNSPLHWLAVVGIVMAVIAIIAWLINWTLGSLSEVDWVEFAQPIKWTAIAILGIAVIAAIVVARPLLKKKEA